MIILIQKELNLIWKSLRYQKLKKINQWKVHIFKILLLKGKDISKKISDLVEKHAKKGVSFDFIKAYFNTKLESDHFKNSLNSYIEAAFLHERSERQKRMMHGQVCKTTNTEKKM